MPPLVLSTNDSIYTNDVTLSDAPAVWMTGDRIRFINSESGRAITTTAGVPAIRMAGADGVVINEAGGVIRSAIAGGTPLVIQGSAGSDRVENAGTIIGLVALGEGSDTFVSRGGPNEFQTKVDLGGGDDFFYLRGNASFSLSPNVDGGAGVDRYVIFESDGNVDGPLVQNVEILDLRVNGGVESFSGLDTIVVDFRAAGHFFSTLRFFNTPNADVQILAETGFASLSVYDRSAIGSVTGSAISDSLDLGNDTLVSGRIDLGGGDDSLSIRRSQFENPQQTSIGEEIDGGAGTDSLSVHLQGGDIFDAGNVVNFERMRVSTSSPSPMPLIIRNVDHVAELVIGQFFSGPVRVEASSLSTGSIMIEPTGSLTISADSIVGFVNSLTPFPIDTVVSDDTKSISIVNQGLILGEVRMYIGDDVLDSRVGTVGGRIYGYAGNDTIRTDTGDNALDGGAGADFLSAGVGNDSLFGGSATDLLVGGAGGDLLDGGAGIDTASYEGDAGAVFVNLRSGQGFGNSAQGDSYSGIENLIGTQFNDFLIGDDAVNRLDGSGGDDVLLGGLGGDVLVGGSGSDTASYEDNWGPVFVNLRAGVGYGNAAQGDSYQGIENLTGGLFADFFIGDDNVNRIDGGGGDDILLGGLGGDVLIGGTGSNTASYEDNWGAVFVNLSTGLGFNNAAEGDSYLQIQNLQGGIFNDFFIGDANANRIAGGSGNDTLIGAGGADSFVFDTALGAGNVDTIGDFVSGTDKIALDDAVFTAIGGLGNLNANAFVAGTAAADASDRIIYDSATGNLYYDADGNGAGAQVLFATLQGTPAIAANDFTVI